MLGTALGILKVSTAIGTPQASTPCFLLAAKAIWIREESLPKKTYYARNIYLDSVTVVLCICPSISTARTCKPQGRSEGQTASSANNLCGL